MNKLIRWLSFWRKSIHKKDNTDFLFDEYSKIIAMRENEITHNVYMYKKSRSNYRYTKK